MGEAFADGPRCTLMAEQERREAEPRGEAAVAAGHPHNMQVRTPYSLDAL
jgi:hypothetical protein